MKIHNKKALRKVYNSYKDFYQENGYPPSYEEVSALTHLSKSYISELVQELILTGYLERPRERVIRVIDKELK